MPSEHKKDFIKISGIVVENYEILWYTSDADGKIRPSSAYVPVISCYVDGKEHRCICEKYAKRVPWPLGAFVSLKYERGEKIGIGS